MSQPLHLSAKQQGLQSCQICLTLAPVEQTHCQVCGKKLELRKKNSIQKTSAYLISAIILFIPANWLPIMRSEYLNVVKDNTILSGVLELWQKESYFLSIVIFTASILVPLLKFLVIGRLIWYIQFPQEAPPKKLSTLYHWTELIGKWSMIDVFVVAISVALFQFGKTLTVSPGPGILAFTGVVILTMLAANQFDPRLLWDRYENLTFSES